MKAVLVCAVGDTEIGSLPAPAPAPVGSGFVCPMHPEVTAAQAGACPKCGMDLVPADPAPQPPMGGG
jgi:hypothetical protein